MGGSPTPSFPGSQFAGEWNRQRNRAWTPQGITMPREPDIGPPNFFQPPIITGGTPFPPAWTNRGGGFGGGGFPPAMTGGNMWSGGGFGGGFGGGANPPTMPPVWQSPFTSPNFGGFGGFGYTPPTQAGPNRVGPFHPFIPSWTQYMAGVLDPLTQYQSRGGIGVSPRFGGGGPGATTNPFLGSPAESLTPEMLAFIQQLMNNQQSGGP